MIHPDNIPTHTLTCLFVTFLVVDRVLVLKIAVGIAPSKIVRSPRCLIEPDSVSNGYGQENRGVCGDFLSYGKAFSPNTTTISSPNHHMVGPP